MDVALGEGIAEETVMEIKCKEIANKVAFSIAENGKQPGVFRIILAAAVRFFVKYVRKLQMPPKSKLKIDIEKFQQMQKVKEELDKQVAVIRHIENVELPKLEKNLQDIKGLFNGKEKKAAQDKIDKCKKAAIWSKRSTEENRKEKWLCHSKIFYGQL